MNTILSPEPPRAQESASRCSRIPRRRSAAARDDLQFRLVGHTFGSCPTTTRPATLLTVHGALRRNDLVGKRPGGIFDHPYDDWDSEKAGECHSCDCHAQAGGESPVEK